MAFIVLLSIWELIVSYAAEVLSKGRLVVAPVLGHESPHKGTFFPQPGAAVLTTLCPFSSNPALR